MATKATGITVTQNAEKPVPTEVLAEAILSISKGVTKLIEGPLSRRTLALLIKHAAPPMGQYPARHVGLTEVEAVLDGIENLAKKHLKPKKP